MKTIIAKTPTDVHCALRHTLSARDYTVPGFSSDADVFEALGQIGPDLVILALEELHLCVGDGLRFLFFSSGRAPMSV